MASRAIVPSRGLRRTIMIALVVAFSVAAISVLLRLAIYWPTYDSTGGGAHNSLVIQHGLLALERNTGPFPPVPNTPMVFNRQFDPGLRLFEYSLNNRTYPGPMGPARAFSLQVPLASPLIALSAILLLLIVPLRARSPRQCACGYDLRGLASERCPECGATVEPMS